MPQNGNRNALHLYSFIAKDCMHSLCFPKTGYKTLYFPLYGSIFIMVPVLSACSLENEAWHYTVWFGFRFLSLGEKWFVLIQFVQHKMKCLSFYPFWPHWPIHKSIFPCARYCGETLLNPQNLSVMLSLSWREQLAMDANMFLCTNSSCPMAIAISAKRPLVLSKSMGKPLYLLTSVNI